MTLIGTFVGALAFGGGEASGQGGTWSDAGEMGQPKYRHTATLLSGPRCNPHCGKVLVVGGPDGDTEDCLECPEATYLFDPEAQNPSDRWQRASDTPEDLTEAPHLTATLLLGSDCGDNCGKILFVPGSNGNGAPIPYLFDPSGTDASDRPGRWIQAMPMNKPRMSLSRHTATLLASGSVLIAGGESVLGAGLGEAEVFSPADGKWRLTGRMTGAYFGHTATLLSGTRCDPNCNKVLAVAWEQGSCVDGGGAVELYDPEVVDTETGLKGSWRKAACMSRWREGHSATLLGDGRVLVAGGSTSAGRSDSAEIFDPHGSPEGEWKPATTDQDTMSARRTNHTTTLLQDGRVLVTGGVDPPEFGKPDERASWADVFDPAAVGAERKWTASDASDLLVERPDFQRSYHTATRLPNGGVLVVGGINHFVNSALKSALLFRPSSRGSGGDFGPSPLVSRVTPSYAPEWGGVEVIVAGENFAGASGVLFGGKAGVSMQVEGNDQIRVRVPPHESGVVPLRVQRGSTVSEPVAFTYLAPTGGKWTLTGVPEVSGLDLAAMGAKDLWGPTGKIGSRATLLSTGRVLLAGGDNDTSSATVDLYHPTEEVWRSCPPAKVPTRDCPGRWHYPGVRFHSATLLAGPNCGINCGNVLVLGGERGLSEAVRSHGQIYEAEKGTWRFTRTGSGVARSRHTATLLNGPNCGNHCGKVLIVGGEALAGGGSSTMLFDPDTETWERITDPDTPRAEHTATYLVGSSCGQHCGKVLIIGGDIDPSTQQPANTATAEIFDPASESWTAVANPQSVRYGHAATYLSDGRVLVLGGCGDPYPDGSTGLEHCESALDSTEILDLSWGTKGAWTPSVRLLFARHRHSATELPNGKVLIAGGLAGPRGVDPDPGVKASELFDPRALAGRGVFHLGPQFSSELDPTWFHTALLLPPGPQASCGRNCGKVLVAGGRHPTRPFAALFTPTPEISGLSPAVGSPVGHSVVTINGTGFASASAVTFDGVKVPFTLDPETPDTTLTAITPPHGEGEVDVVVYSEPEKDSFLQSAPARFTYQKDALPAGAPVVDVPLLHLVPTVEEVLKSAPPALSSGQGARTTRAAGTTPRSASPPPAAVTAPEASGAASPSLVLETEKVRRSGSPERAAPQRPRPKHGFGWVLSRALGVFGILTAFTGGVYLITRFVNQRRRILE